MLQVLAWTGTGFSASIQLSSTSSKILMVYTANGYQDTAGNYYMFNVHRHSFPLLDLRGKYIWYTRLFDDTRGFGIIYGNSGDRFAVVSCHFLDGFGINQYASL